MSVNMLNAKQGRESNRDVRLEEFLDLKKAEYQAYAPFNRVVQLLLGNIARVEPLTPEKARKGVVVTKRKNTLKAALATDVNIVCTSVTEYALSIGDTDLQDAVRFRTSDITEAKDGNVQGIVTAITDAVTPLLDKPGFQEYEITAGMLSSLTRQAEAFSDTRGKAAVIDTDSSIANDDLNDVFKAIRANIASLRRLIPHFSKTNPSFVKGFNASAAPDFAGIRHSGIEGIVKNSSTGQPLEGVIITAKGKKKIAKTNSKGAYTLIKLKVGDMKITISAPGYETQVVDLRILRGKILELNISLQTQVISLNATA